MAVAFAVGLLEAASGSFAPWAVGFENPGKPRVSLEALNAVLARVDASDSQTEATVGLWRDYDEVVRARVAEIRKIESDARSRAVADGEDGEDVRWNAKLWREESLAEIADAQAADDVAFVAALRAWLSEDQQRRLTKAFLVEVALPEWRTQTFLSASKVEIFRHFERAGGLLAAMRVDMGDVDLDAISDRWATDVADRVSRTRSDSVRDSRRHLRDDEGHVVVQDGQVFRTGSQETPSRIAAIASIRRERDTTRRLETARAEMAAVLRELDLSVYMDFEIRCLVDTVRAIPSKIPHRKELRVQWAIWKSRADEGELARIDDVSVLASVRAMATRMFEAESACTAIRSKVLQAREDVAKLREQEEKLLRLQTRFAAALFGVIEQLEEPNE